MAATNYSPISLYYSTTTGAVPLAANLVSGELAINVTDGVLFYKDNAGVVQTLATKAATSGTYTALTITGGTANGVGYLNGSKQFTTNSSFVYDSAGNLGIGGSALYGSSGDRSVTAIGSSSASFFVQETGVGAVAQLGVYNGAAYLGTRNSYPVLFTINNSEQMRLTSTGLGIGTSSPSTRLHINASGANPVWLYSTNGVSGSYFGTSASGEAIVYQAGAYPLGFYTNSTLRATLDASGNLGLGVTPSAWWSGRKAFQVGNTVASIAAATSGNAFEFGFNRFLNSSVQETYVANGAAALYTIGAGAHYWYTAPSGTAGNAISFTQAMTLDASGNLGVGTTSPVQKLQVAGNIYMTGDTFRIKNSASNTAFIRAEENASTAAYTYATMDGRSTGYWAFSTNDTERARIDSSGNWLVGKTSSDAATYGFEARASGVPLVVTNTTSNACFFNRQADDGAVVNFARGSATVGSVSVTTTATAYNTSSDYRLKDNQQPLTGSGAFIDALQPKTWEWKADGSKGVGFIAHEVQAVSPGSVVGEKDAVDEDGNPKYQAMEYGSAEFIANIVAELQSLRKRVAQLEGK